MTADDGIRDEIVELVMGLLDEAAIVASSLDTFRRHEICGRLTEAHLLLSGAIEKRSDDEEQGASRVGQRLAGLGRGPARRGAQRVGALPGRDLDHSRLPAEEVG